MPGKKLTASQENYLEWIDRLSDEGPVQVSDLAHRLGVKLPSVSRAVKGLRALGLVDHESYGTVQLTDPGKAASAEVTRRRDCLLGLLGDVLGMPSEEATVESDRLQHAMSAEVLNRLEALVDFARSSEAWIKRLQLRIRSAELVKPDSAAAIIGESPMHAGGFKNKK